MAVISGLRYVSGTMKFFMALFLVAASYFASEYPPTYSTNSTCLVNGPLQSINKVSKSLEEISTKISENTSSFLDKNQIAMKAAGAILGAAKLRKRKRRSSKKAQRSVDDEEF